MTAEETKLLVRGVLLLVITIIFILSYCIKRKFRIKFVPAFPSSNNQEYVQIKYTTNGVIWKYIYHAKSPTFESFKFGYNWTYEKLIFEYDKQTVDYYRHRFDSKLIIDIYHKQEYDKYKEQKAKRAKELKEYNRTLKETLKKTNT